MLDPKQYTQSPQKAMTQLSIFHDGKWVFTDANQLTFTKVDNFRSYSRMNVQFGVLYSDERDPSKSMFRGRVADYLFKDIFGNLSIIDSDKFNSTV